MFSLAGIPPLFGFWPKLMVFQAAVAEGFYRAGRGRHPRHGGRRLLLPPDRQGDVSSTRPAAPLAKGSSALEGVLIALAALIVSPLGYLLIGPLGDLTDRRRGKPVLSRIRIVDAARLDQ